MLPDVDERSFDIYVEWLLHSKILASPEDEGHCYEEFVDAYAIGLRFEDQSFCAAILHAFVEVIIDDEDYPNADIVKMAYEETPGPCSLRKFLVDLYMRLDPETDNPDGLWDKLPAKFLQDLFMAFTRKTPPEERNWTLKGLKKILPTYSTDNMSNESSEGDQSEISDDGGEGGESGEGDESAE